MTNAPREITLCGATYQVSALTLAELGTIQAWLRAHAKDPVVGAMESLNRAGEAGVAVSPENRKALLEQARVEAKTWPPRVATGPWLDLLTETEGASDKFLAVVLRKHQPDVSDAEVARLNRESSAEEAGAVIARAMGYVSVPKAAGGAETTPAPASSPTTGESASTTSS